MSMTSPDTATPSAGANPPGPLSLLSTGNPMECHDEADIFEMPDEGLDDLAADIRAHGQRVPIEVMDGKILDGRRRWAACQRAGVEPVVREVSVPDRLAYVLSLNLHRRHLNASQRAMVGARARDMFDRQARERQQAGLKKGSDAPVPENAPGRDRGDARDAAGKAVGVSGKSIDHATKVRKHGVPELVKAVDEGRMSVSAAAALAGESEAVQKAAAATAGRPKAKRPPKKRQTVKADPLNDALGVPVPAKLRDVFGDPWIRDSAEALLKLVGTLKDVRRLAAKKSGAYGAFLQTEEVLKSLGIAVAEAEIAEAHLTAGRPHVLCPEATHNVYKCDKCKSTGWLTKSRLAELKADGIL